MMVNLAEQEVLLSMIHLVNKEAKHKEPSHPRSHLEEVKEETMVDLEEAKEETMEGTMIRARYDNPSMLNVRI